MGTIIQGGVVINEGIPRPIDPFGRRRIASSASTLQALIDAAEAGDTIYCERGSYVEAVTITKSGITLVGVGGRGGASIAPAAANAIALVIDGTLARREDITLINIGCEGNGSGGGLHIKGDVRRVRAYGCKFEGGAFAMKMESNAGGALADNRFEDCEFAWAVTAVHIITSGGGDPVTQSMFKKCFMHNFSARGIYAETTLTADLWVDDCTFGEQEGGTAPSDEFIKADVASTNGMITNCRFAFATNASARFAIAADVMWVGNATEAGVTAARPS